MIVIVIIGMLFSILFQTYSRTASLALRIENEHTLLNEWLFLHQFLDTMSDTAQLDSEAYLADNQLDDNGFTDVLSLSQGTGSLTIKANGDCDIISTQFSWSLSQKKCRLEAITQDKTIKLTNPDKIYIANTRFKIFPIQAYSGNIYTQVDLRNIQSDWFQLYGHLYIKNYTKNKREMNVHLPLQTFFSISD